jgi:hypothetical protein
MVSGTVNQGSMLNYAPSAAALPAPVGGEVAGQFSTLAAGFAVFQVFTVDYVEADVPRARAWNLASPALPLIWSYRLRTAMSLGRRRLVGGLIEGYLGDSFRKSIVR